MRTASALRRDKQNDLPRHGSVDESEIRCFSQVLKNESGTFCRTIATCGHAAINRVAISASWWLWSSTSLVLFVSSSCCLTKLSASSTFSAIFNQINWSSTPSSCSNLTQRVQPLLSTTLYPVEKVRNSCRMILDQTVFTVLFFFHLHVSNWLFQ